MNDYYKKVIFVDTETGGQIPGKHSLLSVALVLWDKENGIEDSIELFKFSEVYTYTEEAIRINKFNQLEHNMKAIDGYQVLKSIDVFCNKHFPEHYLIPLGGHNVQFDVNFLKNLYNSYNRSYNKRFSHRILDTYSISRFLVDSCLLEIDLLSSTKLFKHFGINVENRHSAIDDAKATALLYEKMIELLKSRI